MGAAHAAPVGFADSVMTMGELSRDWKEADLMYSFTARDAIAAGVIDASIDSPHGTATYRIANAHYNRLLQRWNLPDAQANLYVLLGAGAARGNFIDGTETLLQPSVQFDYETRRVYFAVKGHLYKGESFTGNMRSMSAGFSFYATEYDQIQPWLIVEARRMGGAFKSTDVDTEITPYLRLIHKRLFVEAGLTLDRPSDKQFRLNFRYTF
jgi:hypothetical protein